MVLFGVGSSFGGAAPLASASDASTAEHRVVPVTIDPSDHDRVWQGWGISLAWWGKVFGERDDIADAMFTTKPVQVEKQLLPGLGFNIVRYNAGSCSPNEIDGRRMVVSKIILPFRQLDAYWRDGKSEDPKSSSWDWSVDAAQRDMLLKARDRGADHFELFSNSPPWWMCSNDNPSGAKDANHDNLPPKNYATFAIYMAEVARHFHEDWGLTFTTVAPFNEPASSWWFEDGKQEGCHFDATSQMAFLPYMRRALDERGLRSMPISASDETYIDHAVATWRTFDGPTRDLVSQVNVHDYQGLDGDRALLHHLIVEEAGRPLWLSEYGDKEADGVAMARTLNLDFAKLRPTAWCYWQALDGGNNGGWGLIAADMMAGTIRHANPKYYVLAQYSRHLRAGMRVLGSTPGTVAAYDAARRRLVLVSFNDSDKPATFTYDLSVFPKVGRPASRWLTEPDGKARYQVSGDVSLTGRKLQLEFAPHAVQTVEITDVELP